jgi:hypothetical protein
MENNWKVGHTLASLVWPVLLPGAGGLWFWLAPEDGVAGVVGVAAVIVTTILGIVWLFRARAASRFNAVVDAYAEQEIHRELRRNRLQRMPDVSTRGSALPE